VRGSTGLATSRVSARTAGSNIWAGWTSRSSCAASGLNPARSRRRCWRIPRSRRRW